MKIIIGVIGTSSSTREEYRISEEVGEMIAQKDCILVCGGLTGVMEGASKGARSKGGMTVGIIPTNDKSHANEYVDIAIATGMGEVRNSIIVNTSDSIIAIGGSFGTLSEISFALKRDIPIVGINSWDVSEKIIKCQYPEQAVKIAYNLAVARRGSFIM